MSTNPRKLPAIISEPSHTASTKYKHVWKDNATGKFVYEDETNTLVDHVQYDTEDEANQALMDYAFFSLDGGIELIKPMLMGIDKLRALPFIDDAIRLLDQNRGHDAIILLRKRMYEIQPINPALCQIITNAPREVV